MTSEENIIGLRHIIESLDSTMRSIKEEIAFQRERFAKKGASLEEKELESKRLLTFIEVKDQDNKLMTQQMADFLWQIAVLTKAIEKKSHLLSGHNRNQLGTKHTAHISTRMCAVVTKTSHKRAEVFSIWGSLV